MGGKGSHATRVAVVGATTPQGTRLREALARRRVAGARVNLFGAEEGEAVISEYAGEARLVQQASPADVVEHEIIFLCEAGELARDALILGQKQTQSIERRRPIRV